MRAIIAGDVGLRLQAAPEPTKNDSFFILCDLLF